MKEIATRTVKSTEAVASQSRRDKGRFKGLSGAGIAALKTGRYVSAFRGGEFALIPKIREGIPAARLLEIADDMRKPQDRVLDVLHIARATAGRKLKEGGKLSPEQSERVLGLERLIGQVQVMVEESGEPEGFNAAEWMAGWIEQPLPALGGAKPAEYLDTVVGQQVLSRLLSQMQSGAYA